MCRAPWIRGPRRIESKSTACPTSRLGRLCRRGGGAGGAGGALAASTVVLTLVGLLQKAHLSGALSERLAEVLGWDPWRGGCDNIMDLREKGELKPLLQEAAVTTVLHRLGRSGVRRPPLSCQSVKSRCGNPLQPSPQPQDFTQMDAPAQVATATPKTVPCLGSTARRLRGEIFRPRPEFSGQWRSSSTWTLCRVLRFGVVIKLPCGS